MAECEFRVNQEQANGSINVREIPVADIQRRKFQTRHSMGDSAWAEGVGELAEDIGRQGQLQPAVVVESSEEFGPPYVLIVGHRRAAACETLGRPLLCRVEPGQDFNSYRLLQMVWAENVLREDWTAVERAELEVRLHRAAFVNGKISTKTHQVAGVPSYPELRSGQTGESRKTIENYLALGNATPELKHEVDIASAKDKNFRASAGITVSGGYSLARFDANTQRAALLEIGRSNIHRAGPQEVAAVVNAVRQRAGQPALKDGQEYAPGEATRTLGADIAITKTLNAEMITALDFYADLVNWQPQDPCFYSNAWMEKGQLARETLAKVRAVMNAAGKEVGSEAGPE